MDDASDPTPGPAGAGEAGRFAAAERLSTRTIFRGRVVELSVDRVRLPNGRESDMEIVHFAGAAAVLPIVATADGEEAVLVRQYRHAAGGWLLELPAGKLDPGEDPEDCARRELAEETGYRAAELEPLGWIWSTPGATDERIWLFAARDVEGDGGGSALEDDEVLELCRLPLAEAVRRAVAGEIHDAKTACALLRWAARRRGGT
jgi:ADP-ribose pyrophosphatase